MFKTKKTARRERAFVLRKMINVYETEIDRCTIASSLSSIPLPEFNIPALQDPEYLAKLRTMRAEAVYEYLMIINKDKQLRADFHKNLATAA